MKITEIPVLGGIIRWFSALFKLTKHFDEISRAQQGYENSIKGIHEWQENVHEWQKEIQSTASKDRLFNEWLENERKIEMIKLAVSSHSAVWGDKTRLHLSPLASCYSCLFNVNSGEIFIGDYTFAGSNVSILAGSHDMALTGLPRRECELHEGCDIHIGKGVWLCSNATVLGPCNIGDNSVIAAGAVILPGTEVPEGTVYGGVPARQIGTVSKEDKAIALKKALARENGIIYGDGFSERKPKGHILYGDSGVIYSDSPDIKISCTGADGEKALAEAGISVLVNAAADVNEKYAAQGINVIRLSRENAAQMSETLYINCEHKN